MLIEGDGYIHIPASISPLHAYYTRVVCTELTLHTLQLGNATPTSAAGLVDGGDSSGQAGHTP